MLFRFREAQAADLGIIDAGRARGARAPSRSRTASSAASGGAGRCSRRSRARCRASRTRRCQRLPDPRPQRRDQQAHAREAHVGGADPQPRRAELHARHGQAVRRARPRGRGRRRREGLPSTSAAPRSCRA